MSTSSSWPRGGAANHAREEGVVDLIIVGWPLGAPDDRLEGVVISIIELPLTSLNDERTDAPMTRMNVKRTDAPIRGASR